MANIVEVNDVNKMLKDKIEAATKDGIKVSVTVGFTQSYALYVHENMQANHPVGQAKFLETAIRRFTPTSGQFILAAMKRNITLSNALLLAGLKVQREAQLLTPVDTGALKGSAFTRVDKQ